MYLLPAPFQAGNKKVLWFFMFIRISHEITLVGRKKEKKCSSVVF